MPFSIARYHIDNTRHGIGAIQHRPRATEHLYTLNPFLVIEIGYMMGIDPGKLRLTVHHHEHSACPVATDSSHLDMPGAAVAHPETYDATLGDKQARDLSGNSGQHLSLTCGFKLTMADDRNRIRGKVTAHSLIGACHNHFIEDKVHGVRCLTIRGRHSYRQGDS